MNEFPNSNLVIPNSDCRSLSLLLTCTSTLIRSRGAAFSTLTICTIGACSMKSSFAYSSGLPGSAASSVTSAGLIARPCTTAALIFSVGAVLHERRQRLGERHRIGLRVGDRRRALEVLLERLERVPLSARLASVFLTTL